MKVINSSGEYAFLMESNSIQYQIERNCDLIQVGADKKTEIEKKKVIKKKNDREIRSAGMEWYKIQ